MPRIKKKPLKIGDIVFTTQAGWGHCLPLYAPLRIINIEPCSNTNYNFPNDRKIVCQREGDGRHGLQQVIPESTLRRWNHETQISPSGSVEEVST